jgi:hypothetical protein
MFDPVLPHTERVKRWKSRANGTITEEDKQDAAYNENELMHQANHGVAPNT